MARPSKARQRREQLRPVIAEAFADLGYRRATTAEIARRCELQEIQLFRIWPDKKSMFLDAIDHVHASAMDWWAQLVAEGDADRSAAERILAEEARRHGESRLYRIVFAGLNESDDPDIRAALRNLFKRFHAFVTDRVAEHRTDRESATDDAGEAAWAIIGLGLVADVRREMHFGSAQDRQRTWEVAGQQLLDRG